MSDFVCAYRTDNPIKADLICAHLEAEDIPFFVTQDNASGVLPQLNRFSSIRIMINPEDVEDVKKILEERGHI